MVGGLTASLAQITPRSSRFGAKFMLNLDRGPGVSEHACSNAHQMDLCHASWT